MNQLPVEVLEQFREGNWVVKGSDHMFNQVDPDHSQEWLNATGKRGGGIVGITKTTSALSRWTLSYNLRAQIAAQTRTLFKLGLDDQLNNRNESTPARKQRDMNDESNVLQALERCKVFQVDPITNTLLNIATKDLVTEPIQDSLLNAAKLGQEQVNTFVKERLIKHDGDEGHIKLHDALKKTKPLT